MADTANVRFIYPPNWDGNPPEKGGWRQVVLQLTGISDGTGESEVTKLDISQLRKVDGSIPTRTSILGIKWNVKGIDNVHLQWDRSPKATIAALSGEGKRDYRSKGGIVDPSGAGDRTGDILLTSNGAGAGGVYDIELTVKLK